MNSHLWSDRGRTNWLGEQRNPLSGSKSLRSTTLCRGFMLPKSRLVPFAFAIFFFGAGLAGAYLGCLDTSPVSEDGSVVVKAGAGNPNSGDKLLHCSRDWSAFRLVQAQRSLKKDARIERGKERRSEALSWTVPGSPGLANYPLRGSRPLLSTFLYPSIAIYQSKVVYRI